VGLAFPLAPLLGVTQGMNSRKPNLFLEIFNREDALFRMGSSTAHKPFLKKPLSIKHWLCSKNAQERPMLAL